MSYAANLNSENQDLRRHADAMTAEVSRLRGENEQLRATLQALVSANADALARACELLGSPRNSANPAENGAAQ